ncbi:hypothetical protein [Photobacterium phosphoreum]|uniref:hypothetical protein n=1 Tax=Photobacterium phosphoreum TaxID=659 RepID=UPI001E5B0859|nr:hypothetical protein [Photobacterium phosphoreum]MCD9472644.1 hypothetical protein [Photobacterium phosphoreum]MCD9504029.1 hypothetical protein [Photobacterium phosphoreum]
MYNSHIFKENNNENKNSYIDWSASKWRDLFLEHYFTSTKDNFPVTYLSITETSLAQLAGESSDQADSVYQAFRIHLPKNLNELESIFQLYGNHERSASVPSPSNVSSITHDPHHLLLLMFSCLVACTDPDPTNKKSQYPERMQSLLGFTNTPKKISGLASMWRAFKAFLDVRNKSNPLSRCLELPNPGKETRIGYAKRLAFPEMRDRQKVRDKLKSVSPALVSPDWVANKFTNLEVRNYSESFKKAHREFEGLLIRGSYGLRITQTKFYEAIEAIVAEKNFDLDTREYISARIDLLYNLDGIPYVEVILDGEVHGISLDPYGKVNTESFFWVAKYGSSLLVPEVVRALKRGVLFFSQLSGAHWRWSPILDSDADLKVLVDQNLIKVTSNYKAKSYSLFENWILLTIERSDVPEFLNVIPTIIGQQESTIHLMGAARVGLGYLLNSVSEIRVGAISGQKVAYRAEGKEWIYLKQQEENYWGPFNAGKGTVLVQVFEKNGVYRYRKFQVHKIALPHQNLVAPKKNNYFIGTGDFQNVKNLYLDAPATDTFENKLNDFLEVIYAEGRHGLTEAELIGWIRRAYPKSIVSRWHVLQSLIDAGWLQEAYRHHWPVRTFFLRQLTCIWQFIGEGCGRLHFDGALPIALRARIKTVLNDNDIKISVGNSLSIFAPPPLFAYTSEIKAKTIAKILNVQIIEMQLVAMSEKPIERQATMDVLQTWCWSEGRFVEHSQVNKETMNGVRLDRLRFKAQHGMDRFQVSFGTNISQYYFPSVAIRAAYIKARKPLFELISERLICITKHLSMSADLARFWRLQTLTSSGPVETGSGGYRYHYFCPDERLLSQSLNLKDLIATDLQEIPFWLKACTFQSIANGGKVLFCDEIGLVSPEIKLIR